MSGDAGGETRTSIRSAAISAAVRLLDLPSRYFFHFLIAASLGVVEAGAFYVAFSVVMLSAALGRLGIDRAVTRAVARAMAHDRPGDARDVVARGYRIVTAMSVAATIGVLAAAYPFAIYILKKPMLAWPITLGAGTILAQCLSLVAAGALAGLHRVALSQMIYTWLWPAIFCIGALVMPITVSSAMILIAASLAVNAIVGMILLHIHMPPRDPAEVAEPVAPLVPMGLALFTSELIQLFLSYAPAFVLGIIADDRTVGLYALGWRIALIINLLTTAVGAIASPRFADLYARGDMAGLARTSGRAIGVAVAFGIAPIVILMIFADPILHRFGPGYAAATMTLRILLIGQTISIFSAATPELLGMTGYAPALRRINFATLGTLIVGLLTLVPLWGAEGAAVATVLTICANGTGSMLAARRHLGFLPLDAFRQEARRIMSGSQRRVQPRPVALGEE